MGIMILRSAPVVQTAVELFCAVSMIIAPVYLRGVQLFVPDLYLMVHRCVIDAAGSVAWMFD